jgi:hypothetical protein
MIDTRHKEIVVALDGNQDKAIGSLSIQGRQVPQERRRFPTTDIRLDPENPRIQHLVRQKFKGAVPTQQQLRALIMEQPHVNELFKDIRDNKGILDRVLIRADGRLIEGNCRAACYMTLADAFKTAQEWQSIPADVLPDVTPVEIAILQGHHHVGGKTRWPTYEKAGHIYYMNNKLGMSVKNIASVMRMKEAHVQDVLKSYVLMTDHILPHMPTGGLKKWSYALEYYKDKSLQPLVSGKEFAAMVVGGKFGKGADVRKLADVLGNSTASKTLKSKNFKDALSIVGKKDPTIDSTTFKRIAEITELLRGMAGEDLTRLKSEAKAQHLLRQLAKAVRQVAKATAIEL